MSDATVDVSRRDFLSGALAAGAAAAVVARHAAGLEAVGGDAHSRHLAPRPAAAAEVAWIDCLHREWGSA